MFTRCPKCLTWFKVTEKQLDVAQAHVRCGKCLSPFDAGLQLWSEPDERSARLLWTTAASAGEAGETPGVGIDPEPASLAGGGQRRGEPHDPLLRRDDAHPEEASEDTAADEPRSSPASAEKVDITAGLESEPAGPAIGAVSRVQTDTRLTGAGPDRIHEGRIAARRRRNREKAILTRIDSRTDGRFARRRGRRRSLACLALLLLLVGQYTWIMAGDLASAFPALAPAIGDFCAVAGCRADPQIRRDRIRVAARTVRPHPDYANAVSVHATLESRATVPRPFPVVVFVLYGKDGRTIGSRAFDPAEYLVDGADASGGVSPGSRVDIGFGLVIPTEVWVSFDLRLVRGA